VNIAEHNLDRMIATDMKFARPLILSLVLLSACHQAPPSGEAPNDQVGEPIAQGQVHRCFQLVVKSDDGYLTDSVHIQLTANAEKAEGRIDWYPGESDVMIGSFTGVRRGDTLDVWYDYASEGMEIIEQRLLVLGDDHIRMLFGEMRELEDERWVYADPGSSTPGMRIPEVPCQ
jgi:hypothetical protein